jgi:hypothetical protein
MCTWEEKVIFFANVGLGDVSLDHPIVLCVRLHGRGRVSAKDKRLSTRAAQTCFGVGWLTPLTG